MGVRLYKIHVVNVTEAEKQVVCSSVFCKGEAAAGGLRTPETQVAIRNLGATLQVRGMT